MTEISGIYVVSVLHTVPLYNGRSQCVEITHALVTCVTPAAGSRRHLAAAQTQTMSCVDVQRMFPSLASRSDRDGSRHFSLCWNAPRGRLAATLRKTAGLTCNRVP